MIKWFNIIYSFYIELVLYVLLTTNSQYDFYRKLLPLVLSNIYIHELVISRGSINFVNWFIMYFILVFPLCYLKFIFEYKYSHNVFFSLSSTLFTILSLSLHDFPFLLSLGSKFYENIVLEGGMFAMKFSHFLIIL